MIKIISNAYKNHTHKTQKINLGILFFISLIFCISVILYSVSLIFHLAQMQIFFLAAIAFSCFMLAVLNAEYSQDIFDFKQTLFLLKHEVKVAKEHFGHSEDIFYFYNYIAKEPVLSCNFKHFFNLINVNLNTQDAKGQTLLHHVIKHNPYSPFIPQILLLNPDLDLSDTNGITARMLISEHCPCEYLIYLDKQKLHLSIPSFSTNEIRDSKRL